MLYLIADSSAENERRNSVTKYWTVLVAASLATLLALFTPTLIARADIFQWEYINPANPGEGKRQSTVLAPGGAGVNAVPSAYLAYRNLTKAYLIGADLTGAIAEGANLTNADLSQSNLTSANFSGYAYEWGDYYTDLTGAIFTNAEVRGAQFNMANLTTAQLYSTASYVAHDLTGIGLPLGNYAGINLAGQNLTNAYFGRATLSGANLSQANLTNANLWGATLSGANLTNADVRGASFYGGDYYSPGSGLTLAQLYSTASYQAHDLTGIALAGNNLAGANLAGQNLTNANFGHATLSGANLSQANLSNAYIADATLDNADLSQANLTNAIFGASTLSGANLTGAEIRGANFNGITLPQLYSTASYQAHDLTGIRLAGNNLAGANLVGQNLTNADLIGATLTNADLSQANLTHASFTADNYWTVADLTGANLSGANLTNAYFGGSIACGETSCGYFPGANLTGANLSGADARGATFYLATLAGANTSNLIPSDGHIAGLDLTLGKSLVVRDYDSFTGIDIPILAEQHLAMDATGTLRLEFDADPWGSQISFAPGIPVALSGTLELTFAPEVDVANQNGRTLDLFDWAGVTPTGAFTVSSPYTWNLTNLYTTGEVTLTAVPSLPGDFNHDGTVDAADYVVWRKNPGGIYTQNDFNTWRAHFGQTTGSGSIAGANATVPEPAMVQMMFAAALAFSARPCRR